MQRLLSSNTNLQKPSPISTFPDRWCLPSETCIGVIISKPELETWEFTSKCGQVSDHAARSDITLLFVSLLLVLAQHVRLRNTLTRILHWRMMHCWHVHSWPLSLCKRRDRCKCSANKKQRWNSCEYVSFHDDCVGLPWGVTTQQACNQPSRYKSAALH